MLLPSYAVGEEGLLVRNSEASWFARLRRWFGVGRQDMTGGQPPESVPNPASTNQPGGTLYTGSAAINEFGQSFIGVVEIGPQAPRVTAGTYAKNVNHLTLSKQNLGPLQFGQRRFGFMRNRGSITVGPSSTGAIPTVDEIPAIRVALEQQVYLTPGGLYLIVAEDRDGELHVNNLATGELIR